MKTQAVCSLNQNEASCLSQENKGSSQILLPCQLQFTSTESKYEPPIALGFPESSKSLFKQSSINLNAQDGKTVQLPGKLPS